MRAERLRVMARNEGSAVQENINMHSTSLAQKIPRHAMRDEGLIFSNGSAIRRVVSARPDQVFHELRSNW